MKFRSAILALGIAATLTGCQNMDSNGLLSSGAEAFQAYSLSDEQVKALSDKACQEMDAKATIAPASSEYSKRLGKIAAALGDNINGQPVNYKVYQTKDVNAFAMANGCIRVYSGLMDLMNDNEVEAVIGHEMGHVALGHVKKGMQVALGTNAVRAAAASAGGIVGSLSQSQRSGREAGELAVLPASGIGSGRLLVRSVAQARNQSGGSRHQLRETGEAGSRTPKLNV